MTAAMEVIKKRKRGDMLSKHPKRKALRETSPSQDDDDDDSQSRILLLENQILESRKHYNNIASLIKLFNGSSQDDEIRTIAAVSLCRVFCRLMAAGSMTAPKSAPATELTVVHWLKARYGEYTAELLRILGGPESGHQVGL